MISELVSFVVCLQVIVTWLLSPPFRLIVTMLMFCSSLCSDSDIYLTGSYGSTLRYKSVERIKPIGKHSLLGASGEISDFQEILRYLDELMYVSIDQDYEQQFLFYHRIFDALLF